MMKLNQTDIASLVTFAYTYADSDKAISDAVLGITGNVKKALAKSKEDQEMVRDNYIQPNVIARALRNSSKDPKSDELYLQDANHILSLKHGALTEDQRKLRTNARKAFSRLLADLEIKSFHGNAGNRNAETEGNAETALREELAKHHKEEMAEVRKSSVHDFQSEYLKSAMHLGLIVDANKALVSEKIERATWDFITKVKKIIKQENTKVVK